MNINEVIDVLYESELDQVELVLIESTGAVRVSGFDSVGSWRGYYNEPALFMGENHDKYDLLPLLRELTTETYYGYKGGEYTYTGTQELVIEECHRAFSGDGYINKIVERGSYIQLICTKDQDDD